MKHTKNNNSSLDFRNSQQFSFESQEFKVCVKLEASTAFKSFSPLKEGRKQIQLNKYNYMRAYYIVKVLKIMV